MNNNIVVSRRRIQEVSFHYHSCMGRLWSAFPIATSHLFPRDGNVPPLSAIQDFAMEPSYQDYAQEIQFVGAILYAITSLDPIERKVLWVTFFYKTEENEFAKEYSHSGYSRIRQKAINDFLAVTSIDVNR
ncbi:MAG: hypothetical protein LKM30_09020 [Bacilli bacterium]|jgi:hypothetical protein|nr:hypothetical protein [Bacilli bacterium]